MKLSSLRRRATFVVALALGSLVALAAPVTASAPEQALPTQLSVIGGANDPKDPNIAVLEFLPRR